MTDDLAAFVAATLAKDVPAPVASFAAALAEREQAQVALFYGSNLRTGALDGVLDFYLLTGGPREHGMWPRVGYHELELGGRVLRAKTATMRLATFDAAARDLTIDTTIWARFVQPAAIAWAADESAREQAASAVAAAAVTAGRYAAALGPQAGGADDYWRALFRATYAAEFRIEPRGREGHVLGFDAARYAQLLPLAWTAGRIDFARDGNLLRPNLGAATRRAVLRRWRRRARAGKPLNVARLVRAAFTFDGAARYAAWKIERHTGVPVPLTPWRERHPVLAAPGVLWRVWRARQR